MSETPAIAIDYFRTISGSERHEPTGELVREILHLHFDITTPPEFAEDFDRSRPLYYINPVAWTVPDLLRATAARHGIVLTPIMEPLLERMWLECDDPPADPDAVAAVRTLHEAGFKTVMASNMVRPERFWARTLAAAGLGFMELVCSSTIGVGKPHPAFYRRVAELADAPPDRILFVGDHLEHDVFAPRREGMRAVWIDGHTHRGSSPGLMVDGTLRLTHLSQLTPGLVRRLTRIHQAHPLPRHPYPDWGDEFRI